MSPDTFHDLLERATQDAPPPPSVAVELAEGRRRLRRRRWAVTTTAALATAAVSVGILAASNVIDLEPRAVDVPAANMPDGDAELLAACRDGNQSESATEAVFGPGTPIIKSVVQTEYQFVLAVESADGAYWGLCWIHLLSAEFGSGMSAYPSDPTVQDEGASSVGTSYSWGGGCGLVGGELPSQCSKWFVHWVDRLPSEVAAVRFKLADGTTTTVAAQDGYVVLNVLNRIAGRVTYDPEDGTDADVAIRRIFYLDAAGDPVAGGDGTPGARDGGTVPGLPPLSTYPSIRGAEIY